MEYLTPEDYKRAKENGINKKLADQRYYWNFWSKERATTEKPRTYNRTWLKLAREHDISQSTFYRRRKLGWELERAATEPVDKVKSTTKDRAYTTEELTYMCRFYDVDGARALACVLNRTETSISSKMQKLKAKGLVDHYKQMWEAIG